MPADQAAFSQAAHQRDHAQPGIASIRSGDRECEQTGLDAFLRFWYLELIYGKDLFGNILGPTAAALGFPALEYKAKIQIPKSEAPEVRRAGKASSANGFVRPARMSMLGDEPRGGPPPWDRGALGAAL
jgi:hypothetical protein